MASGLGDCLLTATLSLKLLLLPTWPLPLDPTCPVPAWAKPCWLLPLVWLERRRCVSSWQRRCKHFCRKRFWPPNLVLSLQYLQLFRLLQNYFCSMYYSIILKVWHSPVSTENKNHVLWALHYLILMFFNRKYSPDFSRFYLTTDFLDKKCKYWKQN